MLQVDCKNPLTVAEGKANLRIDIRLFESCICDWSQKDLLAHVFNAIRRND